MEVIKKLPLLTRLRVGDLQDFTNRYGLPKIEYASIRGTDNSRTWFMDTHDQGQSVPHRVMSLQTYGQNETRDEGDLVYDIKVSKTLPEKINATRATFGLIKALFLEKIPFSFYGGLENMREEMRKYSRELTKLVEDLPITLGNENTNPQTYVFGAGNGK